MRALWMALLFTGLVLVSVDVYEAGQTPTDEPQVAPTLADDGSGMPQPTPTPVIK